MTTAHLEITVTAKEKIVKIGDFEMTCISVEFPGSGKRHDSLLFFGDVKRNKDGTLTINIDPDKLHGIMNIGDST